MSRRLRRLHRRKLVKKKDSPKSYEETSHHEQTQKESKEKTNSILQFYDKNYKKLLIIPFVVLFLALSVLAYSYFTTGSFVELGVSIKGGISITAQGAIDQSLTSIEEFVTQQFPSSDSNVRLLSSSTGENLGVTVELSDISSEDVLPIMKGFLGESLEYSVEETGSSLGNAFFRQMLTALVLAFILMGIVVFIAFRTAVPSLAVILSAGSDMIVTLAIINLLGVKLSLAGIAAFLMLIGYSVDTDVLLTNRVLKRKQGDIFGRVMSAFETGFTMNMTTLAAISMGLIFSQSEILSQIMLILFIGLIVDIMNTWIQNVGILRIYMEKKLAGKEEAGQDD